MEDDATTTVDRIELPPGPAGAMKTALSSAEEFELASEINIAAKERSVPLANEELVLACIRRYRDALADEEPTLCDPNTQEKRLRWARKAVDLVEDELGIDQADGNGMPPGECDFHHGRPSDTSNESDGVLAIGNTITIQLRDERKIADAEIVDRTEVEWCPRYVDGEKLDPQMFKFVQVRAGEDEFTLHLQSILTLHAGIAASPDELGKPLGRVAMIVPTSDEESR